MDNREMEIRACQTELAELRRRMDGLETRLNALEGKPAIQTQPVVTAPVQIGKTPEHQNWESAVGRNLFAVLASVLVLIGVGVFISTIYEQIPQIVKIIAIYVFGFALLGTGLVIYRKNGNKFWLGVASCGLAELLVSIITSHSYFGVLPLTGTFLLVLVWIVGSFLLTKFHPTVFKTIGFVGFIISISLGLSLVEWNETGIYLTLLGAYTVLSLFFMATNKNYVNLNTILAVGSVAGLLMFSDLVDWLPAELHWLSGVLIVTILCVFHGTYVWKGRLHKDAYPVYSVLTVLVAMSHLSVYEPGVALAVTGTVAFLLWFIQNRWGSQEYVRYVYTALVGICLLLWAYGQIGANQPEQWWYAAFTVAAYGLYWLTEKRDIPWLGLLCFGIFYYRGIGQDWLPWAAFPVAGLLFWLCGGQWLRRDRWLQLAWYVVMFLMAHDLQRLIHRPILENLTGVAWWMGRQISDGILFTVLAAANVWYLHRTLADREKILRITGPGVAVMALQGYVFLECMSAVDSEVWFVSGLGILSSMLILSYSLWYTFKIRGSSRNLMIWQFVKFTLYCWTVLSLLDSPGILLHISLLLVAILAVALGFRLGHKAVRIYGLVLSLMDVVSLVLFNIDYGNSLQLAGGIILCGVLCFVISFIYSRLSKVF